MKRLIIDKDLDRFIGLIRIIGLNLDIAGRGLNFVGIGLVYV